jgi:hypothetical protein
MAQQAQRAAAEALAAADWRWQEPGIALAHQGSGPPSVSPNKTLLRWPRNMASLAAMAAAQREEHATASRPRKGKGSGLLKACRRAPAVRD